MTRQQESHDGQSDTSLAGGPSTLPEVAYRGGNVTFRPAPGKVRLVCAACGSERMVDDRPVGAVELVDWWETRGRRCTPCFDVDRPALLVDPTGPQALPTGHDHPDTSRRAAEMAAPRAGSQRALLLDLALEVGEVGMTAYEAAVTIDRSPNQTATRLQELRDQGWLEYATDEAGNRLERATTPGSSGLVQRLSAGGREQWAGTGFAGHAHGVPLPARRERRRREPPTVEEEAMAMLKRAGLLEGSAVMSAGMCERLRQQAEVRP